MNLQEFIEKYEKEAMKIQLNPNVLEVLNEKREAISNPDFEEEKENAYKTAKKMVEYQKKRLRHFIRLNFDGDRLKGYYKGGTPPHLFDLRIYLEYKKLLPAIPNKIKISEKYYALYHWVLIEMGREKPFEKDRFTDRYKKPKIIEYGKNRYKFKTSGQDFYKYYRDTDISNKVAIAKSFGKGYKDKLIEISNNDADIISHLKQYPN